MDLCKYMFDYISVCVCVCVCVERHAAGGRIVQSAKRAFAQTERRAHGIR